MLKYLIIPLSDDAVSFCHYNRSESKENLIPLETLKKAIFWAMKENLIIQFLYPDWKIPTEYHQLIESVDHANIISTQCCDEYVNEKADIIVYNKWPTLDMTSRVGVSYVIRTSKVDLFNQVDNLKKLIKQVDRLVIVITDIDKFNETDFETYKSCLQSLIPVIVEQFTKGDMIQLNLITDRLLLGKMNNCNAGDESLTLAPNGKFYICPAFYFDGSESVGNITDSLDIKNQQLYRLDYAPICRICDAYQCRRCVWLNKKTTLEVNTPSHEQCVIAHIERNSSKKLLEEIRKQGEFLQDKTIEEISYLDPLENIINK